MLNIIKTKSFKITAALLALVLCVTGVVWHVATPVSAAELDITGANVQGYSLLSSSAGTTPLEGETNNPATMSVFVTGGSETKYNADNVKWTHDGTSWAGDGTMLYEGTGSAQKIFACAPYTSDAAGGVVTVNAADQTDWLVATSTDLTSGSVSLSMTHALAKLVIVPSFGTEISNQTVTKIEIGGMYASGNLNIADNTWSDLGTANATLEMTNNELSVIPMAECTEFTVTFTMADARVFTTTVSLAGVGSKLEAGTQYNVKLQVGQDKVTIGGITAAPWKVMNGGELETE
ncbi:MAG: fimbrillin family protein [Clostridia bacterium]|nr:fimbrillin family protein [Clostridia bacterium]